MAEESSMEVLVKKGQTFGEVFRKVKAVVAAKAGNTLFDLSDTATQDIKASPVLADSREGITILRHSGAHLLAQAVLQIYPDALPNAGPPTDEGFYYDIFMEPISSEDLPAIEKRMHELAAKRIPIRKERLSREDLLKSFKHNKFKTERITEKVSPGDSSTVYVQDEFRDFCTGPHVPDTGFLKATKLLSVSSAYYRGDENQEKMVRIYGTAFPDQKSLDEFLRMRDEAAKRDHRKLGQEMDLYVFNSERAPGFPLYTPNGTIIRNEMIRYMRELNQSRGWQEVTTPHVFRDEIWKKSGHFAKYKPNMFVFELNGDGYGIKPMNCPGHITIFDRKVYSYRDLPVKYSEFGTVYRYEKSGEVGGLTRPRSFTVDDGHAFLRLDQIVDEILSVLEMVKEASGKLFEHPDLSFDLSIVDKENPDNFLISYKCRTCGVVSEIRKAAGSEFLCPSCSSSSLEPDFSKWDQATDALRKALAMAGLIYREIPGEAAFYGPKIDIHAKDALNRDWQISTIQVDFFMPPNFGLFYVNAEGKKEPVIMIHRAVYGSLERMMAIVIEGSAGRLPTWLSPHQVFVLPVNDSALDYANQINRELVSMNVRSEVDASKESISKKIRMLHDLRPSYILVVGSKEMEDKSVTVRGKDNKQEVMPFAGFREKIAREIRERLV